jgi:hypothetical protein
MKINWRFAMSVGEHSAQSPDLRHAITILPIEEKRYCQAGAI